MDTVFCFGILVTCQTKRKYNHPRKTRSASDSSCGWLDPVKNLGDYMCRKPKTAGPNPTLVKLPYLLFILTLHTYPYWLCLKQEKKRFLQNSNFEKIFHESFESIVDHPRIRSTKSRKINNPTGIKLFQV